MSTAVITTTPDRAVSTWLTPQSFDAAEKIAGLMAKMGTMPVHLKDKPSDCFRIVVQAAKWQMDPFAVGECTSLVHGRLCYEGKLVHAVLISMGAIRGQLDFTYEGKENTDQRTVTVSGTLANGDTKTVKGNVGDWKTTGNGSPWKPGAYDRQLAYRGTREWARMWAPQAVLGVVTPDEAQEATPIDVTATATIHDTPKPGRVRKVAEGKEAEKAPADHAPQEPAAEQQPKDASPATEGPAADHPEAAIPKTITIKDCVEQATALFKTEDGKRLLKDHLKAWKVEKVQELGELPDEEIARYFHKMEETVRIHVGMHGALK